jgi:hypothetical protein
MKKFSERINESIEDKDPIDPSEDVKEFKEKFFSAAPAGTANIDAATAKTIHASYLEPNSPLSKMFREIETSHPTMTDEYETYRVDRLDDNGRVRGVVGYFRAVSKNHARIKAAIFKNNKEILLTGYYSAHLATNISEEIKIIEDNIKKLQKNLDELKNPI